MHEKYYPFLILASVFTLFHVFIFFKKISFLKHARTAKGLVISAGAGRFGDEAQGAYFQQVKFETLEGKTVIINANMGSSRNKGSEGSSVDILYLPDNPEEGVIKNATNIWGFEAIVFSVGLLGLLVYLSEL